MGTEALRRAVACAVMLGALGWIAGPAHPAHAATDTVSVCDESHLRSAISAAAPGDTVNFSCSGTITLTASGGGTIALARDLAIDGSGQSVTISGGDPTTGQVQAIKVGSSAHVTLSHLSIIKSGDSRWDVGAIENDGALTVTNCTFNGNSGASWGSAIFSEGPLTIANSTFTGNSASTNGGAIYTQSTMTVANSTFSGNGVPSKGGAIFNNGPLTVTNSTFSANSAFSGGAIYSNQGTVTVTNSTFSGNGSLAKFGAIYGPIALTNTILADPSGDCAGDFLGSPTDNGGNLASDNSCAFIQSSSKKNVTGLNLGTLQDNGGPTQTIKLLTGSPAIGYAACLQATDQRGYLRPVPGKAKCDSGAYESGATAYTETLARWSSDGGVDAGFLQQPGFAPDSMLSACPGLQAIRGDFNGDGLADALVYCPSTGAFQKLYGTSGTGPQFTSEPVQFVAYAPGAWTRVAMEAADFNGDGKTDILAYRTDTGAFQKWYSDGGVDVGFTYEPTQYVGGSAGAWTNVQIVAAHFDRTGATDLLVYRPDTGAFQKWFSDGGIDAGFTYARTQYVGNASGAWTNVQMVPTDFNGDRVTDILVYRTDTGAFQKWYSDGTDNFYFNYEPTRYVGNAAGAWTNIRMVAADFDGDGKVDILVYRTDNGGYAKWYSDGGIDAGFVYEPTHYVANAAGAWTNIQMAAADFDGDGATDIVVYRTDTGAYAKWYSLPHTIASGFVYYEPVQNAGGAPGAWANVAMVPADFNGDGKTDLLVSHT